MIVNSHPASSTKGTILYAGEKDKAELIEQNDCFGSPQEVAEQFKQVQELNTRASEKNKTFHASISLPEKDKGKLSKKQEQDMVKAYAKKQGFEKNQWVAYKHNDTKNPHYHFVANRINPETKKSTSISNDRYKNMEFSKEMEQKYNLTRVEKTMQTDKTKTNQRASELKNIVDKNIKKSKSFDDFKKNMEKDGVTVNKGRGLSYTHDKVSFKGSELGRNYSLKNTEKQIEKGKKKGFEMGL